MDPINNNAPSTNVAHEVVGTAQPNVRSDLQLIFAGTNLLSEVNEEVANAIEELERLADADPQGYHHLRAEFIDNDLRISDAQPTFNHDYQLNGDFEMPTLNINPSAPTFTATEIDNPGAGEMSTRGRMMALLANLLYATERATEDEVRALEQKSEVSNLDMFKLQDLQGKISVIEELLKGLIKDGNETTEGIARDIYG